LTPVFNIRGAYQIGTYDEEGYTKYQLYKDDKRNYITYNEQTNYLVTSTENKGKFNLENSKGVI
jgi:hypothetical protein